MTTLAIINAPPRVADVTAPPMTVPPSGPYATVPAVVNTTTDQLAPDGPGLGVNAGQNGIIRIDQTVGGTTMAKNILISATGLAKRPMPFLRENWSAAPSPLNRLQGRVGYQRESAELRSRISMQDKTVIPTPAEGAAAYAYPDVNIGLMRARRNRFNVGEG